MYDRLQLSFSGMRLIERNALFLFYLFFFGPEKGRQVFLSFELDIRQYSSLSQIHGTLIINVPWRIIFHLGWNKRRFRISFGGFKNRKMKQNFGRLVQFHGSFHSRYTFLRWLVFHVRDYPRRIQINFRLRRSQRVAVKNVCKLDIQF